MAYSLTWLAQVLRDAGLKVLEVKGWQSRGRGEMGKPLGVLCHHTAGPKVGNAPSLNVVVNGRSDLPGPLSQLVLGRDGTYFVVAAGRCNHAGQGSWQGVVTGNHSFIGIEAENAGVNDPWPLVQIDAYVRGVAALLKKIGAKPIMAAGHKEYALPHGRKPDPTFDMVGFRQRVASAMAGSSVVNKPIAPTVIAKEKLFERKAPKIVADLMKDFDLNDLEASGIAGNLGHESGGFELMQEQEPRSGIGGYGWAQWTGARRTAFLNWCSANGLSPESDAGNYGFLKHELTDTSERAAIPAVKDTTTLEGAMMAFEEKFERSRVKHYDSRLKYAERALAAYRASRGKIAPAVAGAAVAAGGVLAASQASSGGWSPVLVVMIVVWTLVFALIAWLIVRKLNERKAARQAMLEANIIEEPAPPPPLPVDAPSVKAQEPSPEPST